MGVETRRLCLGVRDPTYSSNKSMYYSYGACMYYCYSTCMCYIKLLYMHVR